MLVLDPEISLGQDDKSKFKAPSRKLAWIPRILNREAFVWKFGTEKGLEMEHVWLPSDLYEDLGTLL